MATLMRSVWFPMTVCLGVNLAILLGIALRNPSYLRDEERIDNPDARHYLILGRNLLTRGEYSRCASEPYVPDVLRTPAYPVLAGALVLAGGPAAVFLGSVALHVLNCGLLFLLVDRVFGRAAAVIAGLLLATDLMVASYNFSAMAETPFLTPLLAGLALIVPQFVRPRSEPPAWMALAAGGLLIGLATLVRPTSLYIGFLLGFAWFIQALRGGQFWHGLRPALVVVAASLLPVAPWLARNYAVFSLPKLTTVDTTNLVYFVGAGAYQLRYGVTLEEAQELIRQEHQLPSYAAAQNHWTSDLSPAEMERRLSQAAPQVLARYPQHLAAASLLAVVKASVSHATSFVAELIGQKWHAPGMANLARLDPSAWRGLLGNGPLLVGAFLWQMAHVTVALLAGTLGAVIALRRQAARPAALVLLLLLGYLYVTVAMFGLEAFYRCRIPVVPFLYVFSAVALVRLCQLASCLAATSPRAPAPQVSAP